jgi:hypothetical protein
LREGHVAARLYYGSLDTLEQARDEALQHNYINAIAEHAIASLNSSSSTSSSPAAVAVVSPSFGPDELSNSESEARGDHTQTDADANHDQSVAVGVFDCASGAVHTDDFAFDDYLPEEIFDEMNAEAAHLMTLLSMTICLRRFLTSLLVP